MPIPFGLLLLALCNSRWVTAEEPDKDCDDSEKLEQGGSKASVIWLGGYSHSYYGCAHAASEVLPVSLPYSFAHSVHAAFEVHLSAMWPLMQGSFVMYVISPHSLAFSRRVIGFLDHHSSIAGSSY
jgi:hypothetical protein